MMEEKKPRLLARKYPEGLKMPSVIYIKGKVRVCCKSYLSLNKPVKISSILNQIIKELMDEGQMGEINGFEEDLCLKINSKSTKPIENFKKDLRYLIHLLISIEIRQTIKQPS